MHHSVTIQEQRLGAHDPFYLLPEILLTALHVSFLVGGVY